MMNFLKSSARAMRNQESVGGLLVGEMERLSAGRRANFRRAGVARSLRMG